MTLVFRVRYNQLDLLDQCIYLTIVQMGTQIELLPAGRQGLNGFEQIFLCQNSFTYTSTRIFLY